MIESITRLAEFTPAQYLAVRGESLPQTNAGADDANDRRQLLSRIASELLCSVNRHTPRAGGKWENAMKAVIVLASELNLSLLIPQAELPSHPPLVA